MLTKADLNRVDNEVKLAKYHTEWYSWQRIRNALEVRNTANNKVSSKLRDLVKELMAHSTISTTQVLTVLYSEFPELLVK